MGVFGRMKRAIASKANAAVDKAIDPKRELEITIVELEQQSKKALEELLAYKTSAKAMERQLTELAEKAKTWETRAMTAVRSGDDALAKECLRKKQECDVERAKVAADRDEAAGYAIELNRARKQFETRLRMLKLKKGTLASQLAAARSGSGNVLGVSSEPFERLERAEQLIDDEAAMAEAGAELAGERQIGGDDTLEAKFLALESEGASGGDVPAASPRDDELAKLKAKMAAERERKQLGE